MALNILYVNDKECIKNYLNENYIIKLKFIKNKDKSLEYIYGMTGGNLKEYFRLRN